MQVFREFVPADRYLYDFGLCSYANGFAQIDTPQDASYFGTWVNPAKRIIFTYCEGDTTTQVCESDEELVSELRRIDRWNVENQSGRALVDPGFSEDMRAAFSKIGAADLMH